MKFFAQLIGVSDKNSRTGEITDSADEQTYIASDHVSEMMNENGYQSFYSPFRPLGPKEITNYIPRNNINEAPSTYESEEEDQGCCSSFRCC